MRLKEGIFATWCIIQEAKDGRNRELISNIELTLFLFYKKILLYLQKINGKYMSGFDNPSIDKFCETSGMFNFSARNFGSANEYYYVIRECESFEFNWNNRFHDFNRQ